MLRAVSWSRLQLFSSGEKGEGDTSSTCGVFLMRFRTQRGDKTRRASRSRGSCPSDVSSILAEVLRKSPVSIPTLEFSILFHYVVESCILFHYVVESSVMFYNNSFLFFCFSFVRSASFLSGCCSTRTFKIKSAVRKIALAT